MTCKELKWERSNIHENCGKKVVKFGRGICLAVLFMELHTLWVMGQAPGFGFGPGLFREGWKCIWARRAGPGSMFWA